MSLPLLLNIVVLVLALYFNVMASQGKLTYKQAQNLRMGILILDVALLVVNLFLGNFFIAVLWGLVLFSNLYGMGFFR